MTNEGTQLAAARGGDERAFRDLVAPYEHELRAYCYRMSGSLSDADDLLQESMLRAWRGLKSFEGRSSFRTWIYRVTWSACIEGLTDKPARMLTIDRGPAADPRAPMPPPLEGGWIDPCPSSFYAATNAPSTPEARYGQRESVALAFLAALQLLPPRQRATLLACDVLGCTAEECADMLDSTVASVTSALQRARKTLEDRVAHWKPERPTEETHATLLAKYVEAWERADVSLLTSLLHEEATLAMPPLAMWMLGPTNIGASVGAMVLTPDARGRFRFLALEANGVPALAAYYRETDDGPFVPRALHLLTFEGGRIRAIDAFLDPTLFPRFGLPSSI